MVDEWPHSAEPTAPPPQGDRPPRLQWLMLGVLGGMGLATFLQYLGWRAKQPGPTEEAAGPATPVEKPPPEPEVIRYPDGRIEHPRVRHEPRDIPFGWIFVFIVVLSCVATVHYYLVWRYLQAQMAGQDVVKRSPFPLAPTPSTKLPPEPRLEQLNRMSGVEESNVYARRAAAEKILHSYGPTEEKGFVRVPIQQAMEMVAGKLPARKDTPQANADGLLDGGGPNSGRIFRGRSQ